MSIERSGERPSIKILPSEGGSGHALFPHPPGSVEASAVTTIATKGRKAPLLHREHWPKSYENPQDAISRADRRLRELGAPRSLRSELFTRNGEFRHVDTSGKDLLSMHPQDAFEHIVEFIWPELKAIEYYLDRPTSQDRPYNAHGEEHLRSTHNKTQELLRNSGHIGRHAKSRRDIFKYPQDLGPEKIATHAAIVAALHDVGYLVDPENHPHASAYLAPIIFPQLATNPQELDEIQRAILLHEGDNLRTFLLSAGVETHEEAVEVLQSEYPYIPAIVIADKADQHKGRVRRGELLKEKAFYVNPATYIEDPHVERNLLTAITEAGWITDSSDIRTRRSITSFRLRTDYSQDLEPEDYDQFWPFLVPASSRPGYKKLDVSPKTRRAWQEQGQSYAESLIKLNLELGANQLGDMIVSSFALNPDQNRFDYVFVDTRRNSQTVFNFYRHTLDRDIGVFQDSFLPQKAIDKLANGVLMI